MLKKVALTGCLLAATISTAHAEFYAGPSFSLINNTSPNGSYRALEPRINIGYSELVSSCTYMALEVFGSPGSLLLNDNTPGGPSLRSTYTFGASLIPGYLITDNVVGYLRLGVVETSFSAPNTSQSGGQIGLGMQTALTQNWHLRGEYIYSAYSKDKAIGAVKQDQVLIGLIYNFV